MPPHSPGQLSRRGRAFAWIIILGVVIALVVIQQRRGDAPAADVVDGALLPIDDAGTAQQVAPAAMPAPEPRTASTTDSGDEAAGMCAQILDDAVQFAVMERNAANPVQAPDPDGDWLRAELDNLRRNTVGSRDPEIFLTTLLLDPNDSSAQTALRDFGVRAANSDSPLLAWHALRACAQAEQFCPFPHLEQRLLEAGRQNAEVWALVATIRYRRGDVAGALVAMQGAARAPTSTWYWAETVALVERSLAAQTSIPDADRLGIAIGSSSGALPPMTATTMCRAESATSRAWGDACLAFGTLRGDHNDTMLGQMSAYSIREQALTTLRDTEGAAEVVAERALFETERNALAMSWGLRQEALLPTDPARLHAFLDAIQQFGETAGIRMFVRQEWPQLLERAGLLERDGARECVAQFFEPRAAVGTRAATAQHRIQVADELLISVRGQGAPTTAQVRPDGMITVPRVPALAAVGKTTGDLQREIATILPPRNNLPPEVLVILISPRSREELRREFDNARRETAERREEPPQRPPGAM